MDRLGGWRRHRPVRVGNAAWNQRQLDVYGELLASAGRLRDQLAGLDDTARGFLAPDGLQGQEGAFMLCSFWLAEALARLGQVDRARAVFETVAGHANDVGLLSEEVDPATGSMLGNFPRHSATSA